MSILKKLQHYRFTDKTINNMIQALKNPNKRPNMRNGKRNGKDLLPKMTN